MGYHLRQINKGQLGFPSKIQEEYEEFVESLEQDNPVMAILELTDLLGAIEAYTMEHHKLHLEDLIKMTRRTQEAFKDGTRKIK